jgi:hypothetical protein
MDYSTKDSSLWMVPELHDTRTRSTKGSEAIMIGVVRSVVESDDGAPIFKVECWTGGTWQPLGCLLMSRFGGVHNFEEYGIRPYYPKGLDILPESSVQYDATAFKAGDNVIVAPLDKDWRQGVILGGLNHPGRESTIAAGDIAYRSCYNGLDTTIKDDGTYLVTWNGKAINDVLLDIPPTGIKPPEPTYDFFAAGSYFGIDTNGSFTVSDANGQLIKIKKSTGNISIVSGLNRIEIGSTDVVGNDDSIGIQTSQLNISTTDVVDIFSLDSLHMQGFQDVSIKGITVAIGNDVFELISGLIELLDEIGNVQVTSPVGPCNPLNTTPAWIKVELIKAKMSTLQGDLVDAENTLTSIVIDEDNLTGGLF